jgi:hypothetical protein
VSSATVFRERLIRHCYSLLRDIASVDEKLSTGCPMCTRLRKRLLKQTQRQRRSATFAHTRYYNTQTNNSAEKPPIPLLNLDAATAPIRRANMYFNLDTPWFEHWVRLFDNLFNVNTFDFRLIVPLIVITGTIEFSTVRIYNYLDQVMNSSTSAVLKISIAVFSVTAILSFRYSQLFVCLILICYWAGY